MKYIYNFIISKKRFPADDKIKLICADKSIFHELYANVFSSVKYLCQSTLQQAKFQFFENSNQINIPKKKDSKTTLLFDPTDFLTREKINPFFFNIKTIIRPYTDILLYDMAGLYEMICISDRYPPQAMSIFKMIDPFNFISYKLLINNKREFCLRNLNRSLDNLIIISTKINEYHPDFKNNLLQIKPWNGKKDVKIMNIIHFLNNCKYMNISDMRNVLKSYNHKNFFKTYENRQNSLFNQRNLLSFVKYDAELSKANYLKRKQFNDFQKVIDTHRKNYLTNLLQKILVHIKGIALC